MNIKSALKTTVLKLANPKTLAIVQLAIAVVTLVQAVKVLRTSEEEEPGDE